MRHPEEANGTAGDIDSGIRSSGDTRQEGRGGRNGERRLRRMGVCGEREKVRKREPRTCIRPVSMLLESASAERRYDKWMKLRPNEASCERRRGIYRQARGHSPRPEGVLSRVADVEEAVLIPDIRSVWGHTPRRPHDVLVLLVDSTHQRRRWGQDLVDEDEDRLLWCELDTLAYNVYELAHGEILVTPR